MKSCPPALKLRRDSLRYLTGPPGLSLWNRRRLVDLVGIEPTTSPAGRGALRLLSTSNRSTPGSIDEISSFLIAARGGAPRRASRTPPYRPAAKVLGRAWIGFGRAGALPIEFQHPWPIRYKTVCLFGFREYRRSASRGLVDLVGIEPTTSSMPWKRAPSCATGPQRKGQLFYCRRSRAASQLREGAGRRRFAALDK
jgi:hypothetical protein